jgi:acetyl esterase/lipase
MLLGGLVSSLAVAVGCKLTAKPPRPFSRERVVSELREKFPQVALPSDELPGGVIAHENLTYAYAGRPLSLDLYQPATPGPHPALLIVHGGGWQSGDRTMERPMAKRLSAMGYVAATVTYRLGPEGRFPNALFDVKAAVRFLRGSAARYGVDAAHIGAVGASAGGQLVALLGATNGIARFEGNADGGAPGFEDVSSSVQAVVDIDGLADFTGAELLAKEAKDPGGPTRFLGGPFDARRIVWTEASAITHVGPASAPTLFINSTAPTPILPGRGEMSEKLRTLGIDSAVVVIPDTPHPFWLVHPWFEPTLLEIHRFLAKHLRTSGPPSPPLR